MISYRFYDEESAKLEFGEGFFEGWIRKPSLEEFKKVLANSYKVLLALDEKKGKIIGFIQVISDGIFSAYIPLLEVLPAYRGQGIGSELVRKMVAQLADFYMLDLCCDEELLAFYENLGFHEVKGMIIRNRDYVIRASS